MVQQILRPSYTLETRLSNIDRTFEDQKISIRLVTLAGTYEKEFINFAKQMNSYLVSFGFKIEIVRSTAPTIGRVLFNNNNKSSVVQECNLNNCMVCPIGIQNKSGLTKSSVTNTVYKVEKTLVVMRVVYMSSQLSVRANIQVKWSTWEIETYTTSTLIPQPFQTTKGIVINVVVPVAIL